MHDGMHCDLIQGQDHEPLKVGNPSIFKSYLLRHLQWELFLHHKSCQVVVLRILLVDVL